MLSAFVDGETSEAETSQVKQHLAGCVACESHLAFLKTLGVVFQNTPTVQPSSALFERIALATYQRPTVWQQIQQWLAPMPTRLTIGGVVAAGLVTLLVLPRAGQLQPPLSSPVTNETASPALPAVSPTELVENRLETPSDSVTNSAEIPSGLVAKSRTNNAPFAVLPGTAPETSPLPVEPTTATIATPTNRPNPTLASSPSAQKSVKSVTPSAVRVEKSAQKPATTPKIATDTTHSRSNPKVGVTNPGSVSLSEMQAKHVNDAPSATVANSSVPRIIRTPAPQLIALPPAPPKVEPSPEPSVITSASNQPLRISSGSGIKRTASVVSASEEVNPVGKYPLSGTNIAARDTADTEVRGVNKSENAIVTAPVK